MQDRLCDFVEYDVELNCFMFNVAGQSSSLRVPGVPWNLQILADQLTLYFLNQGGQIMPPHHYWLRSEEDNYFLE